MAKQYQDIKEITLSNQFYEMVHKSVEDGNYIPEFALDYFDNIRDIKSEQTLIQYAYDINKFFKWLSVQLNTTHLLPECLQNLTIEDINHYKNELRVVKIGSNQKIASDAYLARQLSSLRSFLMYFAKKDYMSANVVELIQLPDVKDKTIVALDKDDITRMIECTELGNKRSDQQVALRDKAILAILVGTGIRVSELVGIDMEDIDLFNARIKVVRKGGDEDMVAFSGYVEDILLEYINTCRPALLHDQNEPALFLSYQGKRLTPRSVQKLMAKYKAMAGINKKVTPHAMRRTFATTVYQQTGNIDLVADSLHHKSTQVARKHYVSKDDERFHEAAKAVDILFEDKFSG